jgi:hypothetical protein
VKTLRLAAAAILATLLAAAAPAHAIDTDPLDFVAPPPGVSVAALYFGDWTSHSQYASGKSTGTASIESRYGVLTAVRFFDAAGLVAGAKVVLPASQISVTTPGTAAAGSVTSTGSGVGDPTLVFPVWLYQRPASRTYFAVIPRIQLPLGAYDANRPSPGAHRFTYALQPGFTTGLGEKVSLDLVADVQVFGDNTAAAGGTHAQDPLFSVQSHLTYELAPGLGASVGAYQYLGGRTKTAGVSNHDAAQTTTAIAGLNYWFTKSTSLQFQYRSDVAVENGARFNGFQFRFLSAF